jgi:hypothetical protein
MDYTRQLEVFKPWEFTTPVHIIGAGATGSWVALFLAKLGIENITVYDFDVVEKHNLPNQLFSPRDIGELKVTALRRLIKQMTGISIKAKPVKVDGTCRLSGIVFMLTDTMASRKEIFEQAIKMKPSVKLLIETRMGLRGGRVYSVIPQNVEQTNEYEKTLYSDDEASVSACGASQSIVATATLTASHAVWQLLNYNNHGTINSYNEMIFSSEYPIGQVNVMW